MALSRFAAFALFATAISAQAVQEESSTHFINSDSGLVRNTSTSPATMGLPQVVYAKVVTVSGSSWLRLQYEGVLLAGSSEPGLDGSFLRLTSMLDGAVQTQHLRHIGEWQDTSAYFNGDSVLVEILAHQGTGDNRLVIRNAIAGIAQPLLVGTDSICGTVDDRVLSYDERVGRNQPTGCTSWLINDCNHCLLTAGHCAGSGLQVVEFNVPLSTGSGSLQHPGPQDQYAVDVSSLQTNGGQGVGNDWAYFGVFPNSTTGLTPHQSNGMQAFDLVPPPGISGQGIRITGNGSTTSPVSPTWYLVQKTHVGPFANVSGTGISYATDTTGGNSGSPVIIDGTNQAIGIHTHAGCNSTGGANNGTSSLLPGLQSALANPLGVCDCPGVEFTFPNGLPNFVNPNGSTVIRITTAGAVGVVGGTVTLNYSTGGAFQQVAATPVNASTFDVTVPAINCGTDITYYISAQGTDLVTYTSPANAPASVHTSRSALALTTVRNYNFNTSPAGWAVANTSLATGAWVRGTPVDPRGPAADFDGSGQCWVTGNVANEDVDGGPTELITETVNLSAAVSPVVSYAIWFDSFNGVTDSMTISASNDGGSNWQVVETVSSTNGWEQRSFNVATLFGTPGQFAMRITVTDQPNDSVTEAAFDTFRIEDVSCASATWNTYGVGCTDGVSVPDLQNLSLPQLGSVFAVRATGLAAGPTVMIVGLAGDNSPLNLPEFASGCTLLARPDVVQVVTTAAGQAVYVINIPNNLGLVGQQIHLQALEFGSLWTMSQGGVGTIQ